MGDRGAKHIHPIIDRTLEVLVDAMELQTNRWVERKVWPPQVRFARVMEEPVVRTRGM